MTAPTPTPTIRATLPAYARALAGRKLAPWTIHSYTRDVAAFAAHLGDDALGHVTTAAIEDWQATVAAGWSPATVAKGLSAIRSHCRWCVQHGYRADDPTLHIVWPRADEPLPRALTSEELRVLEGALAIPADLTGAARWRRARDVRAILLMLYAGLRLSEAAHLRWRNVDLVRGSIRVIDGAKGGRHRAVALHARLGSALEAVPLVERRPEWAVVGLPDGAAMCPKALAHLFERWLAETIRISAHQLRHSFATQMLWHGADILHIQELLGHASLDTTRRYLRLDTDRLKESVARIPESFA